MINENSNNFRLNIFIILGILAFCAYAIRKESEKRLLNKKDIIPIANADCDTEYDD